MGVAVVGRLVPRAPLAAVAPRGARQRARGRAAVRAGRGGAGGGRAGRRRAGVALPPQLLIRLQKGGQHLRGVAQEGDGSGSGGFGTKMGYACGAQRGLRLLGVGAARGRAASPQRRSARGATHAVSRPAGHPGLRHAHRRVDQRGQDDLGGEEGAARGVAVGKGQPQALA